MYNVFGNELMCYEMALIFPVSTSPVPAGRRGKAGFTLNVLQCIYSSQNTAWFVLDLIVCDLMPPTFSAKFASS